MKNDSTPQVSAGAPTPGVGSSDLLAEMNRHIEALVTMKAEPILIQAAANDRHALLAQPQPLFLPPHWELERVPKSKWSLFG